MLKKRGVRLLKIAGILIGLGMLALVVGKLIEDARGKNAWDAYLSERQAKGIKLLWKDFLPPEVAVENNFATHPDLDLKALSKLDATSWPNQRTDAPSQPGWKFAQPYSLLATFKEGTATSEKDAAQQLVDHFAKHSDLLAPLRSATQRPKCRFELNYANPQLIDFPLQEIQYAIHSLNTLALAHLQLDHPPEAHANTLASLRLIRHLDAAPSLIVAMVQIGRMDRTLQALWEGLRTHSWTQEQLQTLDSALKSWDPSTRFLTSLQQDRAAMFTIMEHQSQTSQQVLFRGWAYQNMVSYGQLLDRYILNTSAELDYKQTLELEAEVQRRRTRILGRYPHPYDFFTVIALPSLPKITSRVLQLEANLTLAQGAIQLEIDYLTDQTYPPTINTDTVVYRLKEDATPLLYLPGLNHQDDQGIPDEDRTKGDWTWQYTTTKS